MQPKQNRTRDLEKEREELLKLVESRMSPEYREALIRSQAIASSQPTQEVKTSFTGSSHADIE